MDQKTDRPNNPEAIEGQPMRGWLGRSLSRARGRSAARSRPAGGDAGSHSDIGDGAVSEREGALAAGSTGAPTGWRTLRLPFKLLVLTSAFVMLAEVLIFVPSVANYRVNWLNDRLMSAHLAALSAEAAAEGVIPPMVRQELLRTARVKAVAWKREGRRTIVLPPSDSMAIDGVVDLRPAMHRGISGEIWHRVSLIGEALAVLVRTENRTLRVVGALEEKPDEFIEIVIPEAPLQQALLRYGRNILLLSIIISLFTAALVYIALSNLLVRPMMRITENMLRFSRNPEDPNLIISPSQRGDEVGIAERELAAMQGQLSQLLLQKNRLAQLGLAVSKINHDLRNILANAQLISDRLTTVPDPTVQRFAPKLIATLDRAINFCNDTLKYGKAAEAPPRRDLMLLRPLVEEVGDGLGLPRPGVIDWTLEIEPTLRIDADRDHLYRVLANLCRNATQALESVHEKNSAAAGEGGGGAKAEEIKAEEIKVAAWREGRQVFVEVRDSGPGLPPKAREYLFKAFQSSQRKGGSGLGLAIAYELVAMHGGKLVLCDEQPGTVFRFSIPDRSV